MFFLKSWFNKNLAGKTETKVFIGSDFIKQEKAPKLILALKYLSDKNLK